MTLPILNHNLSRIVQYGIDIEIDRVGKVCRMILAEPGS